MSYQQEYNNAAITAILPHLYLLPTDVQRDVRIAHALNSQGGIVRHNQVNAELGSNNWVIARRTQRIVERYGADVLCITAKQYDAAERRAIEKLVP